MNNHGSINPVNFFRIFDIKSIIYIILIYGKIDLYKMNEILNKKNQQIEIIGKITLTMIINQFKI